MQQLFTAASGSLRRVQATIRQNWQMVCATLFLCELERNRFCSDCNGRINQGQNRAGLESHIIGTSGIMKGLIKLTLFLESRGYIWLPTCVFKGTYPGSHCAIEPLRLLQRVSSLINSVFLFSSLFLCLILVRKALRDLVVPLLVHAQG